MVKIHEYQYEKSNEYNNQEREIEYISWEKYVEDVLTIPKQRIPRQQNVAHVSLPRNSIIDKVIEKTDDKLVLQFYHHFLQTIIIHSATLIGEI